jgi:glyoxylase-like metal-dependent hydrolase (beta-lactamase superfamily II)
VPTAPVRLAPGVWRIPTVGANLVNSFAFVDDDGTVTLVDAGLRGADRGLVAALSEIGRRPSDVARIVLTHAHPDHAGGAAGIRRRTGAPVQIHDEDAGFVRRGVGPPPDPAQPLARVLAFISNHQPSSPVDATFAEGDLVPVAGGLRVLHTPGHSPGHCSFLHERSGVLVTGDALVNLRDRVAYSFAVFCSSYALSKETAERLGEVDYEIAAFTHGPEIRQGAREAVRGFLRARDRPPSRGRR